MSQIELSAQSTEGMAESLPQRRKRKTTKTEKTLRRKRGRCRSGEAYPYGDSEAVRTMRRITIIPGALGGNARIMEETSL